jgi:hypothetical protein
MRPATCAKYAPPPSAWPSSSPAACHSARWCVRRRLREAHDDVARAGALETAGTRALA